MRLEDKLSTLTTVPVNVFDKLYNHLLYIYSNDVVTQLLNGQEVFNVELLEGTLVITLIDDTLHYKFIPNEKFSKTIRDTIITKKSLLEENISAKLKTALLNWKKELL